MKPSLFQLPILQRVGVAERSANHRYATAKGLRLYRTRKGHHIYDSSTLIPHIYRASYCLTGHCLGYI